LYVPELRRSEIEHEMPSDESMDMHEPLSYLAKGIRANPANTAGMPMTTPEKVAVPPKYSAYPFDDETTMKKDNYEEHHEYLFQYPTQAG